MKIVLLFFCTIFEIIIFSFILLLLSTIKLNVVKAKISNFENGVKKDKLEKEFLIYLEIALFGKLRLVKIKLKDRLYEKAKENIQKQDIQKDMKALKDINILYIIKKLKIKLAKLNLEAQFGTEDIMITVFLITLISSIISLFCRGTKHKKIYYNILPLYQYGNAINFNLNCIINVKVVHIIYVIYILIKKGRKANERTSNRRSYDYSYE